MLESLRDCAEESAVDTLHEIVHSGLVNGTRLTALLGPAVGDVSQNPLVPFGVPSPVGPSYPAPAVQR